MELEGGGVRGGRGCPWFLWMGGRVFSLALCTRSSKDQISLHWEKQEAREGDRARWLGGRVNLVSSDCSTWDVIFFSTLMFVPDISLSVIQELSNLFLIPVLQHIKDVTPTVSLVIVCMFILWRLLQLVTLFWEEFVIKYCRLFLLSSSRNRTRSRLSYWLPFSGVLIY